jgi:DNA-binding beta-propeller fold protein YncE
MTTKNQTARALLAAGCWLISSSAFAQSATIFQQTFGSGLGNFTATGTVRPGATGAVLVGSTFAVDGAITSKPISTQGYTGVTVSYDRATAGMNSIFFDRGIVEYAVNGGAFKQLESTRIAASARASFTLPTEASNSTVTLRFRMVGLMSSETFTINNVQVTGTGGGGGGGGPTNPGQIGTAPAAGEFVTFESGHVRPMALSKDGTRLFVVNTPDARLEVFDVTGSAPVLKESVPVGLEPVAVAIAPNGNIWVVNHLSDSISVVDASSAPAKVVNTLLTADEPRDIVFAGPSDRWAFVTAAHRGQNAGFDPEFNKSVGRADVWVFDANNPGTKLGGKPAAVLNMFADTPRALARNADGSRVYAAAFNSGNKTTIIQGGPTFRLDKSGPTTAADGSNAPATGLIVRKQEDGTWKDSGDPIRGVAPRDWTPNVKLNLPDNDVMVIDTTTAVPTRIKDVQGVGTTLFNMAVNPVSGKLYVSNQEARNDFRFEGPGTRGTTVNGHFVDARITVIDGNNVLPRALNKHITSYDKALGTSAEKAAALATPLEMAVTPDGSTLYLASMGTNKLVRINTAQLENDSYTPSTGNQVVLNSGLPTGVVLDAARGRAYVTTRLDNGLSVVNLSNLSEAAHVKMSTPEPADVVAGRKFLYDASYTSSRGDSSCAGCHIFGDMDHLDWDLGNPDDRQVKNRNAYNRAVPVILRTTVNFHPMKGPQNTQSLRGMPSTGPLHWRGDRQGDSTGATLEERAFKDFSVAFPGLLGRESALTDQEMTQFANFALKVTYPPNPVRNLDNSLTANQDAGFKFYMNTNSDTLATCNGCHTLDPAKNRYGTDGAMSFEGPTISENFKIPQLRNMYTKVGSFTDNNPKAVTTGDQIRGYGYSNEASKGSVSEFLNALVFISVNKTNRDLLQEFVLAFPSNLDPVVGQQVTVTPANASQSDVSERLNLLVSRSKVTTPRPECELVAKGVINGATRGWVHSRGTDTFVPDRKSESAVTLSTLLSQARTANSPVTFTCAPPGNGTRLGIDRNNDGVPDGG